MNTTYPTYKYTEDDAKNQLARFVRLDNHDSYPFDTLHAHEYSEILVFTKGGGNHNINFKNNKVATHSIHLLAAHDLHWLERSRTSTGFAIVYKEQLLHKLQMVNPDLDFYEIFNHSRIINLTEKEAQHFSFIFKELLDNDTPNAYQLQIIGAFLTKIALLRHPIIATEKIYDPLIPQIIKLLEHHFKTKKTGAEYADLLNISTRTLHNRIKKASGLTLSHLLQDRILKEAKKLLVISQMNVGEIACELGFNETSHFTHWFKKHTGFLPTEYKYGS